MIIDFHTHVHTPEDAAKPFWKGRCPLTIENALSAMDGAGIDMTVISNPLHEVRGIFEDFPTLKLVGSHVGGGICEIIGRMDYAYELQDEAYFLGSYAPMRIKKKPSEYLKMMYLDSVSYHAPAARCAMETVGVD